MKLNILCIGDIVGRPGRKILADKLPSIKKQYNVDCIIANAENAAGGSGITPQIYEKLLRYGIDLITTGDHVFRKKDIIATLEVQDNIVRPANLSAFAAGKGFAIFQTEKGPIVAVICLIGRVFMKPAECPFNTIDQLLGKVSREADIVVVDFHGEATSEKIAMGYYLDGRVGVCFGTHTHVTTADERILPKGTAYITDIGMTGGHDSVLGRKSENVIKSMRTQMPVPFEIATGDVRISAILATVDTLTKRAEKIERICVAEQYEDTTSYDSDDGKAEPYNGF
ncbi:MAG: TIGR00282 family metallophosphoesterase [Planctomycetota bacterium]